jgi:hypothetical protein
VPVERLMSCARLLRRLQPRIYQAGGWLYFGVSKQSYLKIRGEIVHPRMVYHRYGPGGQSLPGSARTSDPKPSGSSSPEAQVTLPAFLTK